LKSKAQQQQQQQQQQMLIERQQADAASLQVQLLAPGSLLAASCAGGRINSSSSASGSAALVPAAAGSSRKSLMVASFCQASQQGHNSRSCGASPAGSDQQHVQQQRLQHPQPCADQYASAAGLLVSREYSSIAGTSSIACSMSSPAGSASSSRRPSSAGFAGFAPYHQQQSAAGGSRRSSGGGASVLFGANRQHIARMVQVSSLHCTNYLLLLDVATVGSHMHSAVWGQQAAYCAHGAGALFTLYW
jgi:hypothetical protein